MDTSDSTLLNSFAKGADDRAFRQLVERYQDLVFSTALRRTGQRALAEEIAQEVFLLLAQKAHLLGKYSTVAGWLHETTLKVSSNKMKSEIRRQRREQQYMEEFDRQGAAESVPAEARAIIDAALARLGGPDREAIILRFFQGLEFGDIAKCQGSSTEAARKRTQRALDKLAVIFGRKGVATTGTAVAGILTASNTAAPASLLPALASAVVAPATPGSLTILLHLLITMNKIQTTVIALAIIAIPLGIQQASKSEIQRKLEVQEQQSAATPQPTRNTGTQNETPTDTRLASLRDKQAAREAVKAEAAKAMQQMAAGLAGSMDAIRTSRNIEARDKAAKLSMALGVDPTTAEAITKLALENTRRRVDQDVQAMKKSAEGLTVNESEEIGLFDGIDKILSAEDTKRAKDWVKEDERSGLRQMAAGLAGEDLEKLQQVVPLEGDRRQQAFDILMEESEAILFGYGNEKYTGVGIEAKYADLKQVRLEKLGKILTESEMKAYRMVLETEE